VISRAEPKNNLANRGNRLARNPVAHSVAARESPVSATANSGGGLSPAQIAMGETSSEIAMDVVAVGRIDAIPTLLKVLCEITGMGFAAVARVTEGTWTACAVQDDIEFGLTAGSQLDVDSTLGIEVRKSLRPIVIEQASTDPYYRTHRVPRLYQIESYVSVPIIRGDGRYFGNLCAIDPRPAKLADPRILSMFSRFAQLIGLQLDNEQARQRERSALLDERAAGELREQFIAVLGHDLRNPLHAVYAGAEMLERKSSDPALSDIAARIKVNSRRMSALIDDVLDFARGRLGGGIGVELQDVDDLETGLIAVVRELQDVQPDRAIISDIHVTRSVRCDIGRLQQAASNLLGNALAHGSPGSAIKFTVRDEAESLVLDVWNDGAPIPAEFMGKIFEPFWRHASSGSRHGLGLGLHICAQIIRAHRGNLTVTSTSEHGTRFTARLPLGTTSPATEITGGSRAAAAPDIGRFPARDVAFAAVQTGDP
jgi:signal transduction histidine kinase